MPLSRYATQEIDSHLAGLSHNDARQRIVEIIDEALARARAARERSDYREWDVRRRAYEELIGYAQERGFIWDGIQIQMPQRYTRNDSLVPETQGQVSAVTPDPTAAPRNALDDAIERHGLAEQAVRLGRQLLEPDLGEVPTPGTQQISPFNPSYRVSLDPANDQNGYITYQAYYNPNDGRFRAGAAVGVKEEPERSYYILKLGGRVESTLQIGKPGKKFYQIISVCGGNYKMEFEKKKTPVLKRHEGKDVFAVVYELVNVVARKAEAYPEWMDRASDEEEQGDED